MRRGAPELAAVRRPGRGAFGAPRTSSGRSTRPDISGSTQSRPITTLFPTRCAEKVADSRRLAGSSASAWPGNAPADHPMGLATFRVIGSGSWGSPVADRTGSPAGPRLRGRPPERMFVDLTPALRSRVGRAVPRMLDIMEARSAVVLRSLFDDSRFAVVPARRCRRPPSIARVLVERPGARWSLLRRCEPWRRRTAGSPGCSTRSVAVRCPASAADVRTASTVSSVLSPARCRWPRGSFPRRRSASPVGRGGLAAQGSTPTGTIWRRCCAAHRTT